jgi:dipeptidyl aminopeptidase/acylaminoacyl peptidase
MNKKINISVIFTLIIFSFTLADEGYKMPPKAIGDLVDAPVTPNISISPDKKNILILERASLPSIEELSQPELRLAGLRINPMTNGRSRANSYKGILIQNIKSGKQKKVKGLPKNAKIFSVSWSPDSKRIAMSVNNGNQINLYLSETKTGKAKLLIKKPLNTIYGSAFYWLSDSKSLIIKTIIDNRGNPPKLSNVPSGPILQENLGNVSPARTYQDLLTSPYDEDLFDYYVSAQVLHVDIKGKMKKIGKPGVFRRVEPSPDGKYILSERIHRPYSYLVPVNRFPNLIQILDIKGNLIHTLRNIPLAESIPIGRDAVISGPRNFAWRSDVGSTIYYVNALDKGNPNIDVPFRDELFSLSSPFANTEPKSLIKLELRFSNVRWGDKNMALVSARKWTERRTTMWYLNPSNNKSRKIIDRSYEDRYNDPGSPILETNKFGRSILALIDDQNIFMTGNGASPDGDLPFIDEFDIKTNKSRRLWRCKAPYYEVTVNVIDKKKNLFLTRRESKDDPPNYWLRGLKDNSLVSVTNFEHPYPQMKDLYKEMLTYKRDDGIDLSATLYLPPGRKPDDGPLPLLVWAYPREFKTSKAASQVVGSAHRFFSINPASSSSSALIMLSYGYAILMGATMPIIGEGDQEPNDSFIKQLVGSAQAAADIMVERDITTRDQIGIGGHSYGAFMTANLLAHSDIFQAGIARSGAYNRSLTPFGFQSEQRTFWESPEIYFEMSPFMHAQKVNEPILLIHGEADNNSGTFPVQSKRYYHALKGHGATTKLVLLPHESHGYKARESVMHVLWETANWLDTYVKKGDKR